MTALHGTIRNGPVVLDSPPALPEGTRVEVLPVGGGGARLGLRDEDWPATPDAIAAHLARMDQVEPGWLSPEDDIVWRAAFRADREREKSAFLPDAEKLRSSWE
jgi:hypothetical protein